MHVWLGWLRCSDASHRGDRKRTVLVPHWQVLYKYDAVVGTPPSTQQRVRLTLNVHEHESASESDRNDDQLCPERPLKHPGANLLRRPVDENVQRPDDARYCDDVERHRAHDLPSFHHAHLKLLPLKEEYIGEVTMGYKSYQ